MIKPLTTLAATLLLTVGIPGIALARAPLTMPDVPNLRLHAAAMPLPTANALFRSLTRTGVTKPAGAALDGRLGTKPTLDGESRRLGHLIRTAICTGC